jgi:hypothetical protein
MHIYAQLPRWYTRWLNAWVIGNNPIGALAIHLLPYIEDEAREHIGQGIVMEEDGDDDTRDRRARQAGV